MTAQRYLVSYVLVGLIIFWPPVSARLVELEKIDEYIENDNALVEAQWYQAEGQEQMKGHLTRSFAPNVTVDFGHEKYREGRISSFSENFWTFRSSVNLYNGGRDVLTENFISSKANQSNLEYDKEMGKQSLNAKVKYFELVDLENKKEYFLSHREKVRELVEKSEKRVEKRTMLESDLVRLKIHLSHIAHELAQLQLEIDETKNSLGVLLNIDDHKLIHTEGRFPEKSNHQAIVKGRLDVSSQLKIRSTSYLYEQADIEKTQASYWWRPKVDLYASYGRPAGSDEANIARRKEEELAVGFNINFSIGDALNRRALLKSQEYRIKSLASKKKYQEGELLAVDHELRHDIKKLYEMIKSAEDELKYSFRYVDLVWAEFDRGVKEASDLLEAFVQRLESQCKISELNSDYFSKRAELAFLNL